MNRISFAAANVLDKVGKALGDWSVLRSYWKTYVLSELHQANPDAYVISYPKCGRTWLRVMLQNYLDLQGFPLEDLYDRFLLGSRERQFVKFEHDQSNWVPAPLRIDQLSFNADKYSSRKVIFLVRDPRDVLVSSWYHLRFRENIYKQDLSTFIRDDLVGIRKVIAFMNMWVENREVPEAFLLLSYEQIHTRPFHSFERVLKFLGLDVDPENLRAAVEASTFDKMKQMEKKGEFEEPWMRPGAKGEEKSMKVRRGKVGSYSNDLSKEDVRFLDKVILQELSDELEQYYH
jgi:hypothetical protein